MEFSEKKPASGGRPPRDKRQSAKERAKNGDDQVGQGGEVEF